MSENVLKNQDKTDYVALYKHQTIYSSKPINFLISLYIVDNKISGNRPQHLYTCFKAKVHFDVVVTVQPLFLVLKRVCIAQAIMILVSYPVSVQTVFGYQN